MSAASGVAGSIGTDHDKTLQRLAKGALTSEVAREIRANLTGFFTVLAQWSEAERTGSAAQTPTRCS